MSPSFVKALSNIGVDKSIEFLDSIGVPVEGNEGLSLALGGLTNGVSVAQMAGGYSAIANGGTYITPTFYTKVTDKEGNVLYEPKQEEKTVLTDNELSNEYIETRKMVSRLSDEKSQINALIRRISREDTIKEIAKDLKFIENLKPEMCGIGPFIAHKDTPFKEMQSGSISKTLYILSIVRLILPAVLLPATTAVGTLDKEGYEKAILAGANVIMPNLTPKSVRSKYELYNKKAHTGVDAGQNIKILKERMNKIGYEIISSRGDAKKEKKSYGNI